MRTRMTTLPFLLLPLSPFVIFDSDYALILCPLCNSNTLWNISMVLDRTGRDYVLCTRMTTLPFLLLALSHFAIFDWLCFALCNWIPFRTFWWYLVEMQNRTRRHITYKSDNSGFLFFWSYPPLFCFWNWFRVSTVTRILFWIFWWYLVEMRTGRDDMSHKRMTTLPFLLLTLSPFVIFDSDYALILCPLCKLNTLWNILMILGSNEEQDQTSHTRMTTLAFFCTFGVSLVVTYKNDNFGFFFYFWSYLPFLCLNLICLRSVTQIPFWIFW